MGVAYAPCYKLLRLAKQIKHVVVLRNDHILAFCAVRKRAHILKFFQCNTYTLCLPSHTFYTLLHMHDLYRSWKLLVLNVLLSITNQVLKVHKGVKIKLHMQYSCICIFRIMRSWCYSDLNVCVFAGSSTVTLHCTFIAKAWSKCSWFKTKVWSKSSLRIDLGSSNLSGRVCPQTPLVAFAFCTEVLTNSVAMLCPGINCVLALPLHSSPA